MPRNMLPRSSARYLVSDCIACHAFGFVVISRKAYFGTIVTAAGWLHGEQEQDGF
jgi:hypothetical protein